MVYCETCDNVLFPELRKDEEGALRTSRLVHACRVCLTHVEECRSSLRVLGDVPVTDDMRVALYANKYTTYDPTVPRSADVLCPECASDRGSAYVKFDEKNMKYAYICVACDHIWIRKDEPVRSAPRSADKI